MLSRSCEEIYLLCSISLTELCAQSVCIEASLGEALKRLQLIVGSCVGVRNLIFILDVSSIHDGNLIQFSRLYAERDEKQFSKLDSSFCLHFSIQGMHSKSSRCGVPLSLFAVEHNLFSNVCGVCVEEIFLHQRTTLMVNVQKLENARMYRERRETLLCCERG